MPLLGSGFEVSFAQDMPSVVVLSFLLLPVDRDVELSAPSPAHVCLHITLLLAIMIMD